jgi:hypothetical protein
MALADYQKQTRTFELKGGSFVVEGLSFDKFAKLINTHLNDIEAIIALVESTSNGLTDLNEANIEKIVVAAAEEAPGLVANIIAAASGETDPRAVAAAASLPLPVQFEVMMTIVDLTFSEVGGIKKSWEIITSLLKKAAA